MSTVVDAAPVRAALRGLRVIGGHAVTRLRVRGWAPALAMALLLAPRPGAAQAAMSGVWSFDWRQAAPRVDGTFPAGAGPRVDGTFPAGAGPRVLARPGSAQVAFLAARGRIDSVVTLGRAPDLHSFATPDGGLYGLSGRLSADGPVEVSARRRRPGPPVEATLGDAVFLPPVGAWLAAIDHRFDQVVVVDTAGRSWRQDLVQPHGLRFSDDGEVVIATSREPPRVLPPVDGRAPVLSKEGTRLSAFTADGRPAWTHVVRGDGYVRVQLVTQTAAVFVLDRGAAGGTALGHTGGAEGDGWVVPAAARPQTAALVAGGSRLAVSHLRGDRIEVEVRDVADGRLDRTLSWRLSCSGWTDVASRALGSRLALAGLVHGETDSVHVVVVELDGSRPPMHDVFAAARDDAPWLPQKVHLSTHGTALTVIAPGAGRVYAEARADTP